MRMPILAVCVCLWALAPVADATTFEAAKNQLNERGLRIKVAPGRWGQANTEDIEAVLYSVADSFVRYFPDRQLPRILVEPVSGNPRVLFERGLGGEYVIHLSARDRRWSQYAYQFAHELCHILSNFDNEEAKDGAGALQNLWFEESVCDAAALFTLRQMTSTWRDAPPYPHWASYAPAFSEYAQHLLTEVDRHEVDAANLGEWYRDNADELKRNPYLRTKNEVVAARLLPLLEKNPQHWAAISFLTISYLNRNAHSKTFKEYLGSWYEYAPQRDKVFVGAVMEMFAMPTSGASYTSLR